VNRFCAVVIFALLAAPGGLPGQSILPNGSFENGTTAALNWTPGSSAAWATNPVYTGARSGFVQGIPFAFSFWYNYDCVSVPGQAYLVRFHSRGSNTTAGYTVGGFRAASRDFSRAGSEWSVWTASSYVAWIPSGIYNEFRLGAYDLRGGAWFDDVEVLPLTPFHRPAGPYLLGEGESLAAGRYNCQMKYGDHGGNYSRYLLSANSQFNTYQWYLDPGCAVVYRHNLAGQSFSNAQITVGIRNYNSLTSTTLLVQASLDGVAWSSVGSLAGTNLTGTFSVPTGLLPTTNLFVRLGTLASGQFSLTNYAFGADVPDVTTSAVGETHYLGRRLAASNISILSVTSAPEGRVATVGIVNTGAVAQVFTLRARSTFSSQSSQRETSATIPAGASNVLSVTFPVVGFGENVADLIVLDGGGAKRVESSFRLPGSIITDDSFGETLSAITNCPVWWSGSTYKVGRTRLPPLATNAFAHMSAARNEYEAVQVVLRPETPLTNLTVTVGDFIALTNPLVSFAGTNASVFCVEYVPVTVLDREAYSTLGDHPDPLVPITNSLTLPAGTNTPFWISVKVPKSIPAGEYESAVAFTANGQSFTVPVRLKVYDFALTDVTHTGTSYGVIPRDDWHGLAWATPAQQAEIWELYLQYLARYRASPYFPQWYSPIQYSYNATTDSFTYNFAAFDEVMDRYLEEYNFNTFHDLNFRFELPTIPGYPATNSSGINPAYRRLYPKLMQPIYQHMRERGWFDKVFTAWVDEPTPAMMPLVKDGMRMYEETEPEAPRILPVIVGPIPELFDFINLWMPNWVNSMQAQYLEPLRAAGNRLWYYVATGPKAPYPNNFIDHPGLNHRIRHWFTKRQGFEGEDCWGINYYLGNPNPWLDAMSSTGPTPAGITYWGNGDGSLVYPPVRVKPTNTVVIAGPIGSLRMDIIRDGYEDMEYYWLLERLVSNNLPVLGTNHPLILEAQAAMNEPLQPLAWPPIYPFDGTALFAARERIAAAIEALDDGRPFFAKDPLSKVCRLGSNQTLRVEAVGWPIPDLQWQLNGTNLPGATNHRLVLSNLTLGATGDYQVIASNSQGSSTSAVGRLSIILSNSLPLIVKQPPSLVRTNGGRAVFGVGVSSLTPLTYQWFQDNVPLAGATNVTLALSNLVAANAGLYTVVASNQIGAVTSSPATLTLTLPGGAVPPAITGQPAGLTRFGGQDAQFTVTATGTAPLAYKWFFNTTNLLAGATNNVLSLTNVQPAQAGAYHALVSNLAGTATSAVAVLTVQWVAPSITAAPTNLTVIQGLAAQFSVTAEGALPLRYQWFFNQTNLLAGADINVLTLTNVQPAQVGAYTVRITNVVGAVTSSPAMLTLQGLPNYTNEPPGLAILSAGAGLTLQLPPDNRTRTVLFSTNLADWAELYSAPPSAAHTLIPVTSSNDLGRFFRVRLEP
jgi:hypothetical protein